MLNARIKQKLKGTVKPPAAKGGSKRPPAAKNSSPKPRKPVSSPSNKPVVLTKRTEKKAVKPAPRPVPKPERKIPMPIPQPPEPTPPPPPVVIQPPPPVMAEPVVVIEAVAPKVDTEPVVLSCYFSVQILRGESYRHVVEAVLNAADQQGVLFRKLQVMDIMAVGATNFVRFRSDVQELDKVLLALWSSERKRGYVAADPTGAYVVNFQDGRRGKYLASIMNSNPKLGFGQTFAGPRIKRWKQQFSA